MVLFGFALGTTSLRAQGNFVYTNDDKFGPNTVSGFAVASNGTLTPVPGSPFATEGAGDGHDFLTTNQITVSNVGNFLFASNDISNDVSVFSINTATGTLSLVAGSPFATGGSRNTSLSATPDGKFLMVSNNFSGNVTVFSIASSGALTPIAGSPFPTLVGTPGGIKVSPDGKFLAVAEPFLNQVEMFSIASNGSLTSLGAFPGGGGNFLAGVDINCPDSLLYGGETNNIGTIVDGYSVASSGALTPVPGSPFIPGVGVDSDVVLLSSDDKTLFVSNRESNTITVFSVAFNGSLSLVAGSPFPVSGVVLPFGMATNQAGNLLYVADFFSIGVVGGAISVFSVASNGALTEVAGSPFLTGQLQSLTAFPPKSCFQTPQQATQAIINSVNALFTQGVLNGGQDNSLVVKLQHAIDLMNAGKNAAAIGNLNAFIGEVNDLLSSGVLSPSQAASLVSAAESVIARL
jgi:6-phosphogluconolactonase (cycloisomerase 2 family)